MQESIIKLKEIIWEITGRCENKCSFCGSKEHWEEKIDENKIINIAERIVEHKGMIPKEINISGGDPLLVSEECHKKITEILKKAGIICKIIINPKSIKNQPILRFQSALTSSDKIIKYYDRIGMSINSSKEVSEYGDLIINDKTTVITNFNLKNIFDFDDIANLIKKKKNVPWMIQFTIYKNKSDLALYENENKKALDYLSEKVSELISEINIIISDNANPGMCTAGTKSLGILSNGDVVPCLSMRCWSKKMNQQGNLLDKSLKDIWEEDFKDYRYKDFECCKDACKNKQILKKQDIKEGSSFIPHVVPSEDSNQLFVYGVFNVNTWDD